MNLEPRNVSYQIENRKVCIFLYRLMYQKEAVFAAAQSITDQFYVEIKPVDEQRVGVFLEPKEPHTIEQEAYNSYLEDTVRKFNNEVLDQQVRLDLEKRYGNIRELIVRQAFAPVTTAELAKELNQKK